MERKNVTLKLKDEKFEITLLGEEKHLNQITNKIKKIRFYCLESEVRVLTSKLIKALREKMEGQEFMVENTMFAKNDVGSTFFILTGNSNYFVLNNNEVRIPMIIPDWNIKSWGEMTNHCHTRTYLPENKKFILKIA